MENTESMNPNSKGKGLTIQELKKKLGLDKIPTVRPPIPIKKDGKHLYQVAGFFYPLRPEAIEKRNINPQRIMFEVDRDEWLKEMREARESMEKENNKDNAEAIDLDYYPF